MITHPFLGVTDKPLPDSMGEALGRKEIKFCPTSAYLRNNFTRCFLNEFHPITKQTAELSYIICHH